MNPMNQINQTDQINFHWYVIQTKPGNEHSYKVKWTRGVNKILGNGSEPLPVSEKVIQTIKDRMGENHFVKLDEELEEGAIVQFTSGPFKDLMGVFDKKMSDGERVRVLLSLIGVDVPVQVYKW